MANAVGADLDGNICALMTRDGHSESTAGRNADEVSGLRVVTGHQEPPRKVLRPGDDLYPVAAHVLAEQDSYSVDRHAGLWFALLVTWPAADGRRRAVDDLSVAAAALARDGLEGPEIAAALGVSADTLRYRDRDYTRRERPSVDRGEEILRRQEPEQSDADAYGAALLRSCGKGWFAHEALPRVYEGTLADAPEEGFFNLRIYPTRGVDEAPALVEGSDKRAPHGARYLALADEIRRDRWYARRRAG